MDINGEEQTECNDKMLACLVFHSVFRLMFAWLDECNEGNEGIFSIELNTLIAVQRH